MLLCINNTNADTFIHQRSGQISASQLNFCISRSANDFHFHVSSFDIKNGLKISVVEKKRLSELYDKQP